MRRDFAAYVQARHPWTDTFALASLVRDKPMLDRLHPLAIAIAQTYAAAASRTDGVVRGARYPFHDVPLSSASAHLATGLRALGAQVPLLARLSAHVADAARPDGSFADGEATPDVITTLACADLLASVDPGFDPAPTAQWLAEQQGDDGFYRVLGPEAPWLTDAVQRYFESAARPFASRFQWPRISHFALDQKTGLPGFAHFADLAEVFAGVDGLVSPVPGDGVFDCPERGLTPTFGELSGATSDRTKHHT